MLGRIAFGIAPQFRRIARTAQMQDRPLLGRHADAVGQIDMRHRPGNHPKWLFNRATCAACRLPARRKIASLRSVAKFWIRSE
jgi:hypothetical protein